VQPSAHLRPVKQRLVLWSWFGFQVGLGAAAAGGPGLEDLVEGGSLVWQQAAELGDVDHEFGAAW
jgi:hypothetical protein